MPRIISICLLLLAAWKGTQAAPMLRIRVAANGRNLVREDGKAFVPFGLTYYRPDTGWAPQMWKKFDADAIRKDFSRMKKLGVNCVRVLLSFGSFFPQTNALDPSGLAKFDQFLALAEKAGIYVHPTGPDHWEGLPDWAQPYPVGDERVLAALETFWKLFAERYRGRKVIFAYDLRNEPVVRWDPPKDMGLLDYQRSREALADEWTRRQVAVIKSVDPQALVTVGLIQSSVPISLPGVEYYSAFRPSRQAKLLDFMEIHFYPTDSGPGDDERRNLSYLESVVREVAASGKPVVIAEFGWNRAGPDEVQPRWNRRAVETTIGLAAGWLNWGLYDVAAAGDGSQVTGLLTSDGRPKAWANEFRTLARRWRGRSVPPPRIGPRPELDWDRCVTDPAAGIKFRDDYLSTFPTVSSGERR